MKTPMRVIPILLRLRYEKTVTVALKFILLPGLLCALIGCRSAVVEKHSRNLETTVTFTEPSYIIQVAATDTAPWYRELQIVLNQKPKDENELASLIKEHKPKARTAVLALLQEIKIGVEARRKPADKWSLYTLTCGRARRTTEISFTAEVVLTLLYVRRPVISFNNLPLDLCIAKLSRESGMQDSQPRAYNPRIYWSKENVSAVEAINAVLAANGFERRYTDTYHRITLRAQDFDNRTAFVEASAAMIVEKGRLLNQSRPAIIVTSKEKTSEPALPAPIEVKP
ncbi:MAG: hypothetical protein V1899_04040 [Planctomycetota bacterium]